MALQIAEALTTREGSELSSFYLRLEPLACVSGTCIDVEYYHHSSKALFQAGASTVRYNGKQSFAYNRATDGSDVQQFAHDSLLTYLTTSQGVDVEGEAIPPQYNDVTIVDL